MVLKLPEGFIFDPSDKELLEDYLKPKIQGILRWDVIKEKEIYGPNANPWDILNDSSIQWITSGTKKIVYVFTHLTKISDKESTGEGNEGHYVRTAGYRTWNGETGRKPVMDGNNIIGGRRMFVFQINDVNGLKGGVPCYCNMHEYFLKGYKDYMICRITFDTKKYAMVTTKANVSRKRGSTRSKANKKIITTCTTKDERKKALLIESSPIFRDSEKEGRSHDFRRVDSNYIVGGDCSYGLSYDDQIWDVENNEIMILQNLQASMSFNCNTGSDQGLILNKGLQQYDNAGENFRVEEQEGLGLVKVNDDQTLNSEEQAICTGGDPENLGTVLSDFNFGSHDEVYPDSENLFNGDICSDVDNVLMEQLLPIDDSSLDFEDTYIIDSWSLNDMEKYLGFNNNVQEDQQQQKQQQPMQNVSCMLGKRESFDAQEAGPSKKSRI